jgi:exonuclease III
MGRSKKTREGESRHKDKPLLATQNMGGMSLMRWNSIQLFCAARSIDVMGLTEIGVHKGKNRCAEFAEKANGTLIVGDTPKAKDNDPSGQAGILLSRAAKSCVIPFTKGCTGSRIVYVRLKVGEINWCVISAYAPYWDRGTGGGKELKAFLKHVQDTIDVVRKPGDCLILLGDFNAKLAPKKGLVGKYIAQKNSNDAGKALLELMCTNELYAANTADCARPAQGRRRTARRRRDPLRHTGSVTYRPYGKGVDSTIDYILVSASGVTVVCTLCT